MIYIRITKETVLCGKFKAKMHEKSSIFTENPINKRSATEHFYMYYYIFSKWINSK